MTITFLTNPPSSLHIGLDADQSDQRLADRLATTETPADKVALLDAFEAALQAALSASKAESEKALAAKDAALEAFKADAELINTTNRERITQLESQLAASAQKLADSEAKQIEYVDRAVKSYMDLGAVLKEAKMTTDERVAASKASQAEALRKQLAELE